MAQQQHNASRAALSYVNAAEIKQVPREGAYPFAGYHTHKDNELNKQKHKENSTKIMLKYMNIFFIFYVLKSVFRKSSILSHCVAKDSLRISSSESR